VGSRHLADAVPYLLPSQGVLTAFLCRWPGDAAIPVSLPPDASPDEREALEAALRAWEGAGLGVRFVRQELRGTGIELRFTDPARDDPHVAETATAVADCLVEVGAASDSPAEALPARLVFASIHMRRTNLDAVGHEVILSQAELVGSALHELGHALGFQGHVRRRGSVMVREVYEVRRAGRRVLAGERFADPALRALYAVPSGSVVRRIAVEKRRSRAVDRLWRIARARGFSGPTVRVGEGESRIAWRDSRGRDFALLFLRPAEVLRAPERLHIHAYPRAAALLAESGEVP
jgi:hypothetical protein